MGTISDLNELTVPDPLDLMLVREASDLVDRDKKMKLGQLAFKAQTPVALANRVATWKDANTLQDSGVALANVALWSAANTFAAAQTLSGGARFGAGTDILATYARGTWPVTIQGSTGNPAVTFSSTLARYFRLGDDVMFYFRMIIATIAGGGGDVRITLPLPVADYGVGSGGASGVDWAAGTSIFVIPVQATSYALVHVYGDNMNSAPVQIPNLGAGDFLGFFGMYVTS